MPKLEIEHNLGLDKMKETIRNNWKPLVVGVGIAGITCFIMRGRYEACIERAYGPIVTVRPLSFFSKQFVTVVLRDGRGHPGYVVKCLETGSIYLSQAEAAKAMGFTPSTLSQHLNGMRSHIHGFHLERVAV